VVQFEIDEDPQVERSQTADRLRSGGREQLEAHLGHAEPLPHFLGELFGLLGIGHVERERKLVACLSHFSPPVRSRTRATSCASHHARSSSRIRNVARGSANVAVPTPTACAPASIISAASSPLATPPVPITGTAGSARVTSWTARNAIGLIGGPLTPPPPAPRRGARVSASITRPITVLTSVSPVAPASRAAVAIATMSVTFGESL